MVVCRATRSNVCLPRVCDEEGAKVVQSLVKYGSAGFQCCIFYFFAFYSHQGSHKHKQINGNFVTPLANFEGGQKEVQGQKFKVMKYSCVTHI